MHYLTQGVTVIPFVSRYFRALRKNSIAGPQLFVRVVALVTIILLENDLKDLSMGKPTPNAFAGIYKLCASACGSPLTRSRGVIDKESANMILRA